MNEADNFFEAPDEIEIDDMTTNISVSNDHRRRMVRDTFKQLPDETKTRLMALIDLDDPETSGLVLAMYLAGADYVKTLASTDSHIDTLKEALDEGRRVFERMDEAIEKLGNQAGNTEVALKTALASTLSSFGAGLNKTLPTALGGVIGRSIDDAVASALDKHFQPLTAKIGMTVIALVTAAMVIGFGIGAMVFH